MKPDCQSCANRYQGADLSLRCRVHSNGLKCSLAAAEGCKKFRREAGTDAEEITVNLCDCQGRGD